MLPNDISSRVIIISEKQSRFRSVLRKANAKFFRLPLVGGAMAFCRAKSDLAVVSLAKQAESHFLNGTSKSLPEELRAGISQLSWRQKKALWLRLSVPRNKLFGDWVQCVLEMNPRLTMEYLETETRFRVKDALFSSANLAETKWASKAAYDKMDRLLRIYRQIWPKKNIEGIRHDLIAPMSKVISCINQIEIGETSYLSP